MEKERILYVERHGRDVKCRLLTHGDPDNFGCLPKYVCVQECESGKVQIASVRFGAWMFNDLQTVAHLLNNFEDKIDKLSEIEQMEVKETDN